MLCKHPRSAELNIDCQDFSAMRTSGVQVTITWLAQTHFREEYGIRCSRETLARHIHRHLKLPT